MAPSGTRHSRIVKLVNPYVSRKENFDHVPGESSLNTFAGSICTSVPRVEIILFLEANFGPTSFRARMLCSNVSVSGRAVFDNSSSICKQ